MNQPFSPYVSHRLLATTDAGEQAGTGTFSEWEQAYQQLSNGLYRGAVEDLAMPALQVLRESGNRIVFEAGALVPGSFALGVAAAMSGDAWFCGRSYAAGSLATMQPGAEFEMRTADSFEIVAAVFDPAALCGLVHEPAMDAKAIEHALRAMPQVCRTRHGAALSGFLDALLETARNTPQLLASWPAQRQVADEFLELLVACTSSDGRCTAAAAGPGRERVVRRVRQYLARSPGEAFDSAVNVATLCADLGVTRRTLQNSMQEVLGVSPHAYLKAVRLNGVRRSLREHAPERHSIADIAALWGFWHPSQFALDYSRLFGERPSQTRARIFADS